MQVKMTLFVAFVLSAGGLAGCVQTAPDDNDEGDEAPVPRVGGVTRAEDRGDLGLDVTGDYSFTLEDGPYELVAPMSINISVELPQEEGGAALTGNARVNLGLFMPNVPNGTLVPVIADVGPYYEQGDRPANEPANRLGGFLIQNFVQHGYAVAQVSVFGTGMSNHCMDLMGTAEQLGIDAAVTWLGTQSWSNGKVGLIGRSYDGSTPWEAATFKNEHLATILPISGLTGMYELMWRNGSAETRGPIMHNFVYGTFGIDGDQEDAQNACPDYATGPAQGGGAYASGGNLSDADNSYWVERNFLDRALKNYNGSVLLIHGLQDWNVDPHMAFPTHHMLEAEGIEVKGLYGQWAHMYPDRPGEHNRLPSGFGAEAYPSTVRFDWAQELKEWFDHYLMGTGSKPIMRTEVQDNLGGWRFQNSFPSRDLVWEPVPLSNMTQVAGADLVVRPTAREDNDEAVKFRVAPLDEANETRISGLVQLHIDVTPSGRGGQLYAKLEDADTGLRFGHAIMDLRFHKGGNQPVDVQPGQQIRALMEFEALDIVVPAGHGLVLTLAATGRDYLPSSVSEPVTIHATEQSVLRLPVVSPLESDFFTPPKWGPLLEEEAAPAPPP